jgi:DNA-3-methyladenine glycosylase
MTSVPERQYVAQSGVVESLPPAFYDRPVLRVARSLIGCRVFFRGVGGVIVETEAYAHNDPCCHGFRGRTARNEVMFGPPGYLYVYFTYGMHFCANLVCEQEGRAAAVLLRALEPTHGLDLMTARRSLARGDGRPEAVADVRALCSGPAKLTQALGLGRAENGLPAWREPLLVLPPAAPAGGSRRRIATTPRVGVGEDTRPWRFVDAGSAFLSRPLPRR